MMTTRRRAFQQSLALGLFCGFGRRLAASPSKSASVGNLKPDAAGVFALAPGLKSWVVQKSGDVMSDGLLVPRRPDGMGVFESPDGRELILMRNHELSLGDQKGSPFANHKPPLPDPKTTANMYNPNGFGGVSRLVFDRQTFELKSSNSVLMGTERNCAGGWSPWGWLSCEEGFSEGHGYVFLCDPMASSLKPPVKLAHLGRFVHEAACVDPKSLVTYLTEDQMDSCFYRFRPDDSQNQKKSPYEGRLQALTVEGRPRLDTSLELKRGEGVKVLWSELSDIDPRKDTLRNEAQSKGAARFVRGEGLWLHPESHVAYFAATTGGKLAKGQIFSYEPQGLDHGLLTLVSEVVDESMMNMPDNICVTKNGFVIVAEDPEARAHIRVLTPQGEIRTLAQNIISSSELTGVTLSPDESTLFVNVQKDGLTMAIQGDGLPLAKHQIMT